MSGGKQIKLFVNFCPYLFGGKHELSALSLTNVGLHSGLVKVGVMMSWKTMCSTVDPEG